MVFQYPSLTFININFTENTHNTKLNTFFYFRLKRRQNLTANEKWIALFIMITYQDLSHAIASGPKKITLESLDEKLPLKKWKICTTTQKAKINFLWHFSFNPQAPFGSLSPSIEKPHLMIGVWFFFGKDFRDRGRDEHNDTPWKTMRWNRRDDF